MFSDPELTILVVLTQVSASIVKLNVTVSTDTKFIYLWSTPVLESGFGDRQVTLGSSASLLPAPAPSKVFAEPSRIVSEPALLGAAAATFADPELAQCIVPAFSTAHSIQLCITISTNKRECCLRPAQFPEAGVASIIHVRSSALLLLLPSSAPIRAGGLCSGFPVQPAVFETFILVSGMRLAKPELAEFIPLALCSAFCVKSLAGIATDPCCFHQTASHVLEGSYARWQLRVAADLVPSSALVSSCSWICGTKLPQVAERIVFEWNVCFADPKLAVRILRAQLAADRIQLLPIEASAGAQLLHLGPASVHERCPAGLHVGSAWRLPSSASVEVV
mmetsp:Transcript_120959/g.233376  ORF Transcript_120959/g.233376 Transcript_120959/m.233376 type:complete len:335 (-) Transcript_120959:938-1942(-)